jgi:hypothetical protein
MPKAVLGHYVEIFLQKRGLLQNAKNVAFVINEAFWAKTAHSKVLNCTKFINKW